MFVIIDEYLYMLLSLMSTCTCLLLLMSTCTCLLSLISTCTCLLSLISTCTCLLLLISTCTCFIIIDKLISWPACAMIRSYGIYTVMLTSMVSQTFILVLISCWSSVTFYSWKTRWSNCTRDTRCTCKV